MDKIIYKVFVFIMVFFCINASPALSEDYTCYFKAPKTNDVWVIAYSADREGNRGRIIWKGKIPAGERIEVTCDTGHIRYEYTMEEDKAYEGDLERFCEDGNEILVL